MFEVEAYYTIKAWSDDDKIRTIKRYPKCQVIEINGSLLKIRQPLMDDLIINTSAITFVSAQREGNETEYETDDIEQD